VASAEALRRVALPGGFVDDAGRVHDEVEIAILTGAGEEAILSAPADMCAAALITTLLAHGVRRIGTLRRVTNASVRDLLVQDREFLLIRLRELTLGPDMWVRVQCPRAECAQSMEIKLRLDTLPVTKRPVMARYAAFDDAIEFRLPTGDDQEAIAAAGHDGADASRFMLERCLRHRDTRRAVDVGALDAATIGAIELQMQEAAPDVTPEMDAVCPDCRHAFVAEVDLPFLILTQLRAATRRLEEEVHVLAWNYHWAESDILAMSRPKRARYVRLIEEQLDRFSTVWGRRGFSAEADGRRPAGCSDARKPDGPSRRASGAGGPRAGVARRRVAFARDRHFQRRGHDGDGETDRLAAAGDRVRRAERRWPSGCGRRRSIAAHRASPGARRSRRPSAGRRRGAGVVLALDAAIARRAIGRRTGSAAAVRAAVNAVTAIAGSLERSDRPQRRERTARRHDGPAAGPIADRSAPTDGRRARPGAPPR